MNTKTDPQAQPLAVLSSAELGPKPAAWRYQQATYGVGDVRGRGWLPALKFTKPGWECMQKDVEPLYDQAVLDAKDAEIARLNSERLDLALFVGRLIRRMRAARIGEGLAEGDAVLEEQVLGYMRRKGLSSPLRHEAPNAGIQARP